MSSKVPVFLCLIVQNTSLNQSIGFIHYLCVIFWQEHSTTVRSVPLKTVDDVFKDSNDVDGACHVLRRLEVMAQAISELLRFPEQPEGDDIVTLGTSYVNYQNDATGGQRFSTADRRKAQEVLRQWMMKHFAHPYPTEEDKAVLSQMTGMSTKQVTNGRSIWWQHGV